MECPACAANLADDAQHCAQCGWQAASKGMGVGLIILIVVLVGGCLLLGLVGVIAAIAIPNLIEARKAGNESAAIGALMTLSTAQSLFREGDKENDTNFDYGTLTELSETMLIDGILGSGTKQGYEFECLPSPTTSEFLWTATANPVVPETTGSRYFGTNQAGVIFYSLTGPVQFDEEGQIVGDAVPVGR